MANNELRTSLLCELLHCGCLDLSILDDTDEDYLMEAIDQLKFEGIEISLNAITFEMFGKARYDLGEAVEARIEELQGYAENDSIEDDERKELEALKTLTPDDDLDWYCNCLDTSINFSCGDEKIAIYEKYMGDKIEELENLMGFEIMR